MKKLQPKNRIFGFTLLSVKILSLLLLLQMLLIVCEPNDISPLGRPAKLTNGVFVINEGNFTRGNASLSFFNVDSSLITNHIFEKNNRRVIGDVAFSMTIIDSLGFVVVNNSGKIEVINLHTLESIETIMGFTSPRYMLPVNDSTAYISDLYSRYISILNTKTLSITGKIDIGKSTEQMVKVGEYVFVANWSKLGMATIKNNTVQVIRHSENMLIDSISVGKEPQSMVVDKEEMLWVLCSGGFMNEEFPALYKINTDNFAIENELIFNAKEASPDNLIINSDGDMLYFNSPDDGIFQISIHAEKLPDSVLIPKEDMLIYSIAIHPQTNRIYIGDALDYTQNGFLHRYDMTGTFIDSHKTGICPGFFCF